MQQIIHKYIIFCGVFFISLGLFAQDKITIEPVNFNTPESEYAPVYFKEGIVYCGINTKNEALTYVDKESGKQLTDLFYVEKDSNGFSAPKLLSKTFKSSFHDGPITFSGDGKTAYFTRSQTINKQLKNNIKLQNKLGVYSASFDGVEWGNIQESSFNSSMYNVGQPSLSADGQFLFVTSDKEGGYGGKDIYYTQLKNGKWGDLVNLGPNVNSASNEMFPFVDARGKLFYSSDKEGGYGGLDIYSAIKIGDNWEGMILKDTVFNSSFDDFSIVWNKDQTEGYFTSNRNGSDDIFKISIIYPEFTDCQELKEEQLCFEFFEEATLNADSVAMIYEWNFGDGTKEQSIETYHCYEKSGLYIVELNVMDTMINKTFINEATYELEILTILQPLISCPDSVFLNEEFTVEVQQGTWTDYTIENSYIDFGNEKTIKSAKENYNYNTLGEKTLQILISGFDTELGELKTNCFYKTIKVQKEVKYKEEKELTLLEKQGFTVKEKRDNEPTNNYYTLEVLTSSKSILNDSTTLKSFFNKVNEFFSEEKQLYTYSSGKVNSPFDLIEMFREAHKEGFANAIVKQIHTDGDSELSEIGLVEIDTEGNTNIILKGVLFNYGSYALNANTKKELNQLITFLQKNPNIKVEIEAHTDNQGNAGYNQKLSQKRATSVVDYLIQNKIKKQRLKAKGYGETKPVASNETEEGRSLNRRVAFKIIAQ